MASQEFGKRPGQEPYFGGRELAEMYVNGTIHEAYFGDHGEDPVERLTRFSRLIDGEETGRTIATRVLSEFDAGMIWQIAMKRGIVVMNVSATDIQRQLSVQMRSFLGLPNDQRVRFVQGLREQAEQP